MKSIIAILLTSISLTANATCPDVVYLKKSQPAPCVGYLFSPEKEKELRGLNGRYKVLEQIITKQDEKINSLSYSLDKTEQDAVVLKRQLGAAKAGSTLEKIIYFGLGLLAGYGVGKVVK